MDMKSDLAKFTDGALRARLSRCVRNSEAGWLFYSPGGNAYHLLADEAEAIERRGNRLIDRCNRFAHEFYKLPKRLIVLAIIVFAFTVFSSALHADAGGFVIAAIIMLAGFVYLMNPIIVMCMRNTVFWSWQANEARRLRKGSRGGVPSQVELHHRRYNLFRILFNLAFTVLVFQVLHACVATQEQLRESSLWPIGLSICVMALTFIPARKVDHTHRRRKWLD